jgi:alpha-glucosidase
VVARRSAGEAFDLPLGPARHLLGSEPGGADLGARDDDGVAVPASDGPRLDVWELDAR